MFSQPSPERIARFLAIEKTRTYNYKEVGCTRKNEHLQGFDNDLNSIELGEGPAVFAAAKKAIKAWRMFPKPWTFIAPENTPIQEGVTLAMCARVLGFWWLNSCRIVYVIDNERQFGFAYGTLPGHVECGEELFLVEMDANGKVSYQLKAFSTPRNLLVRLGYPIARMHQRKFARDSKAAMLAAVQETGQ